MANRMKEVARLFGVKLEEVFYIEYYCPEYVKTYLKFTEMGLMHSDDRVHWDTTAGWLWTSLIKGDFKINKLPWKPQEGEKYYIPRIAIRLEDRYYWYHWQNSDADIKRYTMGLVCKTREEAIEMTKKMLAVVENER